MLSELEQIIGYGFSNQGLLLQAVTHKSYGNEFRAPNNERLEFLGDTVLDLIISDYLMLRFPEMAEGELSKFRAVLVSEAGLSRVARELKLGHFMRIGKGEETTGGREKSSILANAFEAVMAAVYLDSKEKGIKLIEQVILNLFAPLIEEHLESFAFEDVKTDLQEWVQKRGKEEICYQTLDEQGPDHDKSFLIGVYIGEKLMGKGEGKNKKSAEQQAASDALHQLKKR